MINTWRVLNTFENGALTQFGLITSIQQALKEDKARGNAILPPHSSERKTSKTAS